MMTAAQHVRKEGKRVDVAAPASESTETIPIVERMDVEDFHRRWRAARVAALRQVRPSASTSSSDDESALLQQLHPEQQEEALKAVYYNARKLGRSTLRYFSLLWDEHDVRDVLSVAEVPCLQGQWTTEGQHFAVERGGCDIVRQCGAFACEYWTEAIDGLLMGLGDQVRHHRRRSVGYGDELCRDVFSARTQHEPAYGPLPEHLTNFFHNLEQRFAPNHFQVQFVGYAAGVVYYTAATRGSGCTQKIWRTMLQNAVAKTHPTLRLHDISPTSVFDREDNDHVEH
jgi:hypothetical protein